MKKKFRYLLLKLLYPILRVVGKIHSPYSHKEMSGEDFYAILKLLKRGHVFVTITYGELTNIVIPGKWSHGAMYAGEKNGIPMIVEAVGVGVVTKPLVDFLLEKDEVRILEPNFADEAQMSGAVDAAMKQLGAAYDYGFEFTIEPKEISLVDKNVVVASHRAFYCIELVIWGYMSVVKNMPFKLRKRFGEPEVTPDDLALAHDHWKCIWDKRKNGTRR